MEMASRLHAFLRCVSEQLTSNVLQLNFSPVVGSGAGNGMRERQPALTETGTGTRHQRLNMPFLTANEYRSSLRTSSTNRLSISSRVRVRMRDDLLDRFQASWLLFAWRVYRGEVIDRCFLKLAEHPWSQGLLPPTPPPRNHWELARKEREEYSESTHWHRLSHTFIRIATRPGRLFVKRKKGSARRGKNYTCRW